MWTRSPKSSKCGREVRKAIKMDSKYWTRNPESSKYHGCAVGMMWLASIAICRTIKNLLDNGISFGSPGRPVESFCFGDANGGPAFRGPDARPPGLLLALHGHIETFSKGCPGLCDLCRAPCAIAAPDRVLSLPWRVPFR
ncbi:hypothetical protein CRG98_020541 [Punica granatum]|uniref:Uncharacterized protein n=1 Tax=Punica granatum TaxID=22663 RepID=A0A2I0JT54_PUNGR|nr:hypothetical protein CRG98_020541 [Punica granatum]